MIVIHALWLSDSRLGIWGENSTTPVETVPPQGRLPRGARPRPHPFASDTAQLENALAAADHLLGDGVAAPGLRDTGLRNARSPLDLTLLLPSVPQAPEPSPHLLRIEAGARPVPTTLAPWTVPALALEPGSALELLLADHKLLQTDGSGENGRSSPTRLILADSFRFWAEVARFAVDLTARGMVVPTVEERKLNTVAVWRPVPQGDDAERVEHLAASMPASSRAEWTRPAGVSAGATLKNVANLSLHGAGPKPPAPLAPRATPAPRFLLDAALAALVDACVRESLEDHPLLRARGRRPPAGRPAAEAWLAALIAPDPVIQTTPAELEVLRKAIAAWVPAAAVQADKTLRTSFRLSAPAALASVAIGAGTEVADAVEDAEGAFAADTTNNADTTDTADAVNATDAADAINAADVADVAASATPHHGGTPSAKLLSARPPESANTRTTWRLDFFLQATDDPSILVPAAEIWEEEGHSLEILRSRLEDPQEHFLGDLGRALRLFPELERALRTATPVGLDLDTATAHRFLREVAPRLEEAGFGVLVPSWWTRPAARLGLRLRTRPREVTTSSSGLLGLDALCEYEWQVALGGETITLDELRKLARLKLPLVQIRGEWVELRSAEIESALRLLEEGNGAPITAVDALRLGLGAVDAPAELPVVDIAAGGWLGELLGIAGEQRIEPIAAPAGFVGELRPYQARGLAWLAFLDRFGLGACLADDMGLGKTIQLLALLLAEREAAEETARVTEYNIAREAGRKAAPNTTRDPETESDYDTAPDGTGSQAHPRLAPTLLICPMSVVGNWQREAARFAPGLRVHVHHGGERLSGGDFARAVREADVVITTYALAARDRTELAALEWGRVVLDEAQNIKNSASQQARAIRAIPAPRRVALTGTPVENRLTELWSIMEFLNPGLLGGITDFRARFATPIERHRDEERAAQLKRLTAPFILRRLKTDRSIIRDLPEKIEMNVYCNLTREQATLYQAVVDDMLAKVEASAGIERKGLVLSTILKLKQVCNHPAHLLQDRSPLAGRSGKLARLEETLEEVLAAGDRALVFTQFAQFGHLLRAHLQEHLGRKISFLHGGTTQKARDAMVAEFQADDGPPVLLLSLKAGGTGLNLTAANHVIHFDRWWNPAVEDQATDRAFRIGQTRQVQARKFICVGTIEERIDRMIEEKRDLADRIVGTGEGWLTELSTAELRELVALAADAVVE